jgi:hypothetical protein
MKPPQPIFTYYGILHHSTQMKQLCHQLTITTFIAKQIRHRLASQVISSTP